jgi:hypothetical protein
MANMRTTLAIDDDVLVAARHLADREGKSIGEVISALARRGLAPSPSAPQTQTPAQRNGIPLLPARAGAPVVTLAVVNQLRDELP